MKCRYCVRRVPLICGNPVYTSHKYEPSTGIHTEEHRVKASEARSATGLCGPEALLFHPRAPIERAKDAACIAFGAVAFVIAPVSAIVYSYLL